MANSAERLRHVAFGLTCAGAVSPLISIAASHILLGAAVLAILLARVPWRFTPAWPPLAAFIGWTVTSWLLGPDLRSGLPQIRKFYVFLALVVTATMIRELSHIRALVWGWVTAATASSLWGLWQFYSKWEHARQTGENFYLAYVASRITGFMSHWMTFSGVIMVAALFAFALLLFGEKDLKRRVGLAVALAVMALALALSFTRGAWLGALGGAAYLLWSWRRAWLLILPGVLVVGFLISPQPLRERVRSFAQPHGDRDSNAHRRATLLIGIEMIKAHPWFGVGLEQVGRQYKAYIPPALPRLPDGYYGHLHNIYIHYAAERGIPASLAMLWFLIAVPAEFLRALRRQPNPDSQFVLHGAVAATIGILVTGCFEYNLGDSEVLQLYLTSVAFGFAAVKRV